MNAFRIQFRRLPKLTLWLLLCLASQLRAQSRFFVDGFHGGVYGHYPLDWYTDFMLAQLEAHPQWCINLELEPETWDSVRVRTPEAYERFVRAMGEGRIEVVNPAYAQPYMYNISGESIIRQLQYGMRRLSHHFPGISFLTYSSEEPCFTSALPQILSQLGFRYVVLKNPDTCWGGYASEGGGEFVLWEGPDGSVMPCVPRYDCEALEPGSTWQTTAWQNSPAYQEACRKAGIAHPVGMCLQDAGWRGGPWLKGRRGGRGTQYVLWRDYFDRFLPSGEWPRRRFGQDDFRVALMWGSDVVQRIARQVREEENLLVQYEKLGAMMGIEYGFRTRAADMDRAWHSLMLSQHHDSWIVPYNNLRGRQSWADMILGPWGDTFRDAMENHRQALWQSVPAGQKRDGEACIRVFNTTAQERHETVAVDIPSAMREKSLRLRDALGNEVPVQEGGARLCFVAHVPAFGYATYLLSALEETPKPASAPVSTDSSPVLENSLYRMEVNLERGGTVEHLILKHHGGRDMVDSASAYAFGELRGYFGREGRFCSSVESPASIDSVNRNPLEQSISLTGQIAGMLFHKTITMREGSPLIEVSLTIRWNRGVHIGEPFEADWRENRRGFYDTRYILSVLFPAAVRNPVLSKDAPFDVCESHQPTTFFNRWDSIRHNVLLHWADLASQDRTTGMALFSDRTTSYSYAPSFPLALTLQYAGPGLWGRMYPTGAETSVRYALYPHEGQWEQARVEQYAEAWQEPLIAKVFDGLPLRNRSLLQTDCPHLEITTASASDGAFTFRLYNASRNASSAMLRLGLKGSSLAEEDLQGRELRRIPIKQAEDGTVCAEVSLPPFGIRTYRLRYAAP